ncbi:MAG TPA: cytochrome b [Allosphingosinicella sp.]|nr:cytochrome b [Allosphingosinicella sp.]
MSSSPNILAAPDRYSTVSIWLHWLIAGLLVANLLLGFYHEDFSKPVRASMMWWHKSIGLTVLALTIARLGWRLGHRPPPFDAVMKPWERKLASLIHWLFYAMLILIPLSGWLIVSSGKNPTTSWFGLLDVPPLPLRGEDAHELMEEIHEIFGYTMIGLIVLHVAGALKHHFEGHRHLIGRMAPWAYRSPAP